MSFTLTCLLSSGTQILLVWMFGSASDLPQDIFRSGIITAAMAPGVNSYVFANMYGRAKRVAASSVLIGTAGSILTVWMWLTLLR